MRKNLRGVNDEILEETYQTASLKWSSATSILQ